MTMPIEFRIGWKRVCNISNICMKAMEILNSMTHDMYERITTEAARLLRITGAHVPCSHLLMPPRMRQCCSSAPRAQVNGCRYGRSCAP